MAVPTGVNEGSPQEPMNPALTQAAPAEGDLLEAGPAEAEPAEAEVREDEVREDEPAEAETTVGAAVTEDEPAGAEPAGIAPAEGELGEGELAGTETGEDESYLTEPAAEQEGAEHAGEPPARDMSPLAIMGVIVTVIALVGVAAGVLAVVTHGFHRKTVVTYRTAAVFKLKPGDCVDSSGSGLTFTLVACSKPHNSEVFATFTLPESAWPGSAAVQTAAGNGCASRLTAYLNPQLANAGLAQEYVYPDQSAWQAHERTVVCEVRSPTGQITGSVRKPS
jgi:hypothetical protein